MDLITIGIENQLNKKTVKRHAVRAIIYKDDKLLMIRTNKNDVKFPGGGKKSNESDKVALKREVLEETGYELKSVEDFVVRVVQRKNDQYDPNAIFEMTSDYYFASLNGIYRGQLLDDYEKDLDFKPVWISIESAIQINTEHLKKDQANPWTMRELEILKYINDKL